METGICYEDLGRKKCRTQGRGRKREDKSETVKEERPDKDEK